MRAILKNKGFTLVELIVVITIIAILGTIAFISLQGYSKTSRDSVRVADLNNIKTGLELFQVRSGKYPIPTNGVDVTFSGSVIWSQGTVGDTVIQALMKMSKKPLDPLTYSEYTYSVTTKRNEYELGSIYEGDDLTKNTLLGNAYAEQFGTAYVTGNYNGQVIKMAQGNITYVLAVPSLISSDTANTTLIDIINNNSIVYNGYANLPASYNGTNFTLSGSVNETFITGTGGIVVFSGSLDDLSNIGSQLAFMNALQNAYTGTSIASTDPTIATIVSYDTTGDQAGSVFYAQTIIQNNVDSTVEIVVAVSVPEVVAVSKTVLDCGTGIWTNPGDIIYGTVDGTDTGLTCNDDIIVCNATSGSGVTISACNVGANVVSTAYNDTASYGELFQWGNNAGIKTAGTSTTRILVTDIDSTFSSATFIYTMDAWHTIANHDNLWGDVTNTNEARKGPCEVGYHVPTITEMGGISWDMQMSNALKIPISEGRHYLDANLVGGGVSSYYWSSSTSGPYSLSMPRTTFPVVPGPPTFSIVVTTPRSFGLPVRCFKN